MSTGSPSGSDPEGNDVDVYISYSPGEVLWANRLAQDLGQRELRAVVDSEGEWWSTGQEQKQTLWRSRCLALLLSRSSESFDGLKTLISRFEGMILEVNQPRPVIPIVLGGPDVLQRAPSEIASRNAVVIGSESYKTGPNGDSKGWQDAVETIAAAVAAPLAPRTPEPQSDDVEATAPPTARVHRDRWTLDDRLDYALYAKAIAEFIRHPDAEPPMVISVQAPWGQGKTSLMRMVQKDLDPDHPDFLREAARSALGEIAEPPSALTLGDLRDALGGVVPATDVRPKAIRTVWFNAWKYQSSEQVWAGLAHAILSQLPARLSDVDRERFWLQLQRRRIDPSAVRSDIHQWVLERFVPRLAGWAALVVGTVIVGGLALIAGGLSALGVVVSGGGLLGVAWVARRAWATATKEVLARPLEGAYVRYVRQPDYASRLGYLHLVEEDMARALELLTPENEPAVIFVDDLDRCSPANVGEVIEAMNLFLAGEYPNCTFVIGIDAEVVAASMEVVHAEIIAKLSHRRGELGWHFLDKFVQLPFVIPRLDPDQRVAYLRGLFSTPRDDATRDRVLAEADELKSEIHAAQVPVDELARRVGELAPRLAIVEPEQARALGEEIVSAGASAFSDNNPEVIEALAGQMRYLSDNPRTIKRAVNLYRFHRFAAFARQASTLPLKVATPEQIGRWVVVMIRWPHFVRWLQTQRDADASTANDPTSRILELAASTNTAQAFEKLLTDDGISASWTSDAELWEFLHSDTPPELGIELAPARGLW